MREIVFDTETTGLRPEDGDRIVEIGCIEMIDRIETGRTFHSYYNPERDMPAEAERVHGLSAHFLSDKPLFSDGAEDLVDFIGDARLVAHNAGFDMKFLNAELRRCDREAISLSRMVDTAAMARSKFPGSPASLDALCTRFGVDRSHRVKHGALLDAELLVQVYIELTGGRQIGLALAEIADDKDDSAVMARSLADIAAQRPVRAPRPFAASEEECERHAAFIARMERPLWNSRR